ncbi:MAG TPA: penicillin acylase family protein [Vicinamibacterales bacterium]|nr:penicillin acylase family protein [Vicinamibacterales bacterium]
MSLRLAGIPLLILGLASPASPSRSTPQQPRTIELDAATLAARTEAARSLIPLLEHVREKARARYTVEKGSVPDSPFAGTQTTLFAITIGSRNEPVNPQVIQAMDRLLEWEPGDRTATEQAELFDTWLTLLSKQVSIIATRRGWTTCDTSCVVTTVTELDEWWGSAETQRPDNRDRMLLETLADAVTRTK